MSDRGTVAAASVVMRKELLDGLRDRRSLVSALLFPLFGPVLVGLMFSYVVRSQSVEAPLSLRSSGPTARRLWSRPCGAGGVTTSPAGRSDKRRWLTAS